MSAAKSQPLSHQELEEKVQRLELLMDISRQFSSTLDFNKLMNTIFEKVLKVLQAEAGSFWIPDAKTNEIVCSIAEGPAKDEVTGLRLKKGVGIVGWVMEHKQSTVIFDASKDERFSKKVDEATHFVTKSMLCIPLIVKNECLGAIQVINKKTQDGQFNQSDLQTIETLATSGAIAVKNARLYQSERRIKEMNALLHISKEITATLDQDRVLLSIVNLGSQVIDYRRAVVGLLEGRNVKMAAETGQVDPDINSPENQQLTAIMNYVVDSARSMEISRYNPEQPPQGIPQLVIDYMNTWKLQSLSVILLSDEEGLLGVLSMEGENDTLVPAQSRYVLTILLNQIIVAIRNASLYRNISSSRLGQQLLSKASWKGQSRRKLAMTAMIAGLFVIASFILPVPESMLARFEVVPEHQTQVSALQNGFVEKVHFREGDLVKKGEVLIEMDDAALLLEKSKLENEKLIILGDLQRLQSEGSPDEFHLKGIELKKVENQLKLIGLQLTNTQVRATSSGRVLTPRPEEWEGKQVVEGEVVAHIAKADEKRIKVFLEESQVLKIPLNATARLALKAFPGALMNARLEYLTQSKEMLEEQSYYVGYFESPELNQEAGVKFGMTGKSKVQTGLTTLYRIYLDPLVARMVAWIQL